MDSMKKHILFITNLPAPYKVDYLNELGKHVQLDVVFERSNAKNRASAWTSSNTIVSFQEVTLSGIRFGNEMCLAPSIIRCIRKNRDSLILLNGYSSPTEMLAIRYMTLHGIKFGLICDGMIEKAEVPLKSKIKTWLIGSADFWMSSGEETDRALIAHGAIHSRIYRYPFSSIHESDIPAVPYNRVSYKERIGCKSQFMLLYVGQMIHRKGVDILMQAIKGIDLDLCLYLIGDEIPVDDGRVVNLGFLDQHTLKQYYMAADLFVLPSREDIWGLVVNEAMGYGVPVLATDRCGAALEMVDDGKNGAVVPVENVQLLRERIIELLQIQTQEAFMLNAVQTAKEYTIESMTQSTLEIIQKI